MPVVDLCLTTSSGSGGVAGVRLGEPLLDAYLEFVAARCRPNTVLATAFDLKVFFAVVAKPAVEVTPGAVLGFMTAQRVGVDAAAGVALVDGGGGGVSARTVRRRLSSVSGLFAFLQARGDLAANPVPRSLPTRRERSRPGQGFRWCARPGRCEDPVSGPGRRADLRAAHAPGSGSGRGDGARRSAPLRFSDSECRISGSPNAAFFLAEGKGGHQRLIRVSGRFFSRVKDYLDLERPVDVTTDRVFVVLKGPRRGQPLSVSGLDEVLDGARRRAGLDKATAPGPRPSTAPSS